MRLAYFERPGTSNGATEAINGRLEHLSGSAIGFRDLTVEIAGSLLKTGGFRPPQHTLDRVEPRNQPCGTDPSFSGASRLRTRAC